MCVTHGKPCVNMHGFFEAYIRGLTWAVLKSKGGSKLLSVGASRRRRVKGKREREERRREREERKGERKEEKRRRKGRMRGKRNRKRKECCAMSRPGQKGTQNCTQEVGFLLLWLSTPRVRVMAYGSLSGFQANLFVVYFVCDCVMVKDQFLRVLGLSETKHCVSGQQNPEQNGKRGCAQISAHHCESATSTLDSHNFLV